MYRFERPYRTIVTLAFSPGGELLASGVYVYVFRAGSYRASRRAASSRDTSRPDAIPGTTPTSRYAIQSRNIFQTIQANSTITSANCLN